jgi:N-acetylglucosaminyldiphosphoundecaprenol N-acetyl-beta-D-mannosaminyltransferase
VTVGGVMGYLGGDRPTPPRWLGRFGLEWLYRLVTEPRRLWRRYLIEPLPLVRPLVREIWDARSRRW